MSLFTAFADAMARRRIVHARLRLAAMVEAKRCHPDTVQYRAKRAAALKHTRGIA